MPGPVIPSAGVSPLSFFVPLVYVEPGAPPAILADPIDPHTGEYLSIERGYDPTDAAVLTALTTIRGSGSAVLETGQRFRDATHVTRAAATFLRSEAELALRHLIEAQHIRLESIDVVQGDDFLELAVRYINLARGELRVAVLPWQAQLPKAA